MDPNPPIGHSGQAYAGFTPAAQGGTGGFTITKVSGELPSGMSFNAGTISGTPGESGNFTVTFGVTDSSSHSNSQTLKIFVDPLSITTTFLPVAQVGVAYNTAVTATGISPFTWYLASGTLPPGAPAFAVNSNGSITGTPTSTGSFFITLGVVDSIGRTTFRSLTLQVNP